jgi:two-component system, NtrC family, C4-dicarboxylate transport sensor histidine kinase DctB
VIEPMHTSLDEIRRMSVTLNEFGEYFQVQTDPVIFNPVNIISRTARLLEPEISGHYIHIILPEGDDSSSEYNVRGYESEFKQFIVNLMQNARDQIMESRVKHGFPAEGLIKVSSHVDSGHIYISIGDNGGGVLPEHIEHIFTPYFSAKSKKGLGLGLYMGKILIEREMGGILTFENTAEGAMFHITLPVVDA